MSGRTRLVNIFARLCSIACVSAACAACALAQESRREGGGRQRPAAEAARPGAATAQGEVDENFELNIAERRITEQNFFASTAVATAVEATRGVNLQVGVAVGAERIDVTLRNVRGRVRFRGSLDALRRVLDARRPAATDAPPTREE